MDNSITARRDRIKDQADDLYEELYQAERDRREAEWKAEFGDPFPFRPDVRAIHNYVLEKMNDMKGQP